MAQCTAHAKSGERCRQPSIAGGRVCRYHGGSAPQVRNAAARRLAVLIDPAIGKLEKSLKSKTESIAFRAAQDILDRNNMKGDNIIRLLTPETTDGIKLSDEQVARIQGLEPQELAVFARILGFIETGEREPAHKPEPAK